MIIICIVIIILNSNKVFAKIAERVVRKYQTHIGMPVLNVVADEKKIVTSIDGSYSQEFYFSVKNWDENYISSMDYYYEIKINFEESDINYQVWNLDKNEMLDFNNNKSKLLYMDLTKKEVKYKLVVDLLNSTIPKSTSINLNIAIVYKERSRD